MDLHPANISGGVHDNMKRNSIQMKLTWTFCTAILCSLLVTNVLTGIYIYQIQSKNLLENYQNIGENISAQIKKDLSTIENFARLVCFDANLQNLMRSHLSVSGYTYYQTLREITSSLSQYVTLRDDLIDDIYIIDKANNIISRNDFYSDTLSRRWYQEFLAENTNFYFTDVYEVKRRDTNYPSNQKKVVSCIVNMFDLKDPTDPQSFMGHVIINIKYDTLVNMMEDFRDFDCLIYKQNGISIEYGEHLSREQIQWAVSDDNAFLWEGNHCYFRYPLTLANWILVVSVDISTVNSQILYGVAFLFIIMIFIMYLTGKIVFVMAKNITEPLKTLTNGIHQFSTGDFDTRVTITSGDEIEEISLMFNDMVERIKDQMNENVRKESEKRKSEMRFLMDQSKPNFIYNSLNCIIYLARRHKDEDIIKFTRAFISLLQISIRMQPQQEIPILVEIEHLKNYITLIQYRYDNAPDFQWEIADSCIDICLPGLILLPIVENSIFHGLLPKNKSGHIFLTVEKEEKIVKVTLRDDGNGIPPDKLKRLRQQIQGDGVISRGDDHIGLFNVNERLKLSERALGTLHITSQIDEGTQVWFYLQS